MAAHTPAEIKPSIMTRRAKKALDPDAAKKGVAANGKKADGPSPEEKAREEAKEEWYGLRQKWSNEFGKRLSALLTPGRLVAIAVMSELGFFGSIETWRDVKSVKKFLGSQDAKKCLALLKDKKGPAMADILKLIQKPEDIDFRPSLHAEAWPVFLKTMGGEAPEPLIELEKYVDQKLKDKGLAGLTKDEKKVAKEESDEMTAEALEEVA
jgi:hypothetical protein